EEMVDTFQTGTLFDHYCARVHVGSGIDRVRAYALRTAIHASAGAAEKGALVAVFREGSRVLGRSLLEAPAWVSDRFNKLAERWVRSGGNPDVPVEPALEDEVGDTRWID